MTIVEGREVVNRNNQLLSTNRVAARFKSPWHSSWALRFSRRCTSKRITSAGSRSAPL